MNVDNVALWFASLNIPYPTISVYLAGGTEALGAIFLALGLAVRWMTIPLMFTMIVAAYTVHWQHGWNVIAERSSDAAIHLNNFLGWLQQTYPERYEYITELGKPVMLQNGIEFAATYFIMLLVLFFIGGGRYVSLDYWISRRCEKNCNNNATTCN